MLSNSLGSFTSQIWLFVGVIWIFIIILAVLLAVVKRLGAKKRAENQMQRDIDYLVYKKEVNRIAEIEYRNLHSMDNKR